MAVSLTKPAEGTVGWASDINQNFTTIENQLNGDISYYRQAGTSPFERWYIGGMATAANPGTANPALGTIYATPFISSRGGTLDRLIFWVKLAAGAGGVGRAGIYRATSKSNLYPDTLVVDGGEFATTSTGGKIATINVALDHLTLYWLVVNCGTAAPTLHTIAQAECLPILGVSTSYGPACGISVSSSYGALPSTFPAGGTPIATAFAMAVRYSA